MSTSEVCVAVEVDEENAEAAHEAHESTQGTAVLGLGYLRNVGRSRQHEGPSGEPREEPPDNEGDRGEGEVQQKPAGDEWK